MKIAILTHPLRTNYGGILQNFALQKILKRMGHHVETIDCHEDKTFFYRIASFVKRNISRYIFGKKYIPTGFHVNLSRKEFLWITYNLQTFIQKYINTTEYIQSFDKLSDFDYRRFECYIVGSDQVWLPQFAPRTYFDFLSDKPVIKIAYAASFGTPEWIYSDELTKKCKVLINQFKAISVREDSAVDLCMKYFGVETTHVLDPTLLLKKEDYVELIEEDVPKTPDLLFTYFLDPDESKENIAAECKRQLGLKNHYSSIGFKNGDRVVIPSISNWLSRFRDADFILTDSFHGLVFSIIFQKQFLVIANYKRGIARFTSLLSILGLQNRLISEDQHFITTENIDYKIVQKRLEEERTISINFLEKAISE